MEYIDINDKINRKIYKYLCPICFIFYNRNLF